MILRGRIALRPYTVDPHNIFAFHRTDAHRVRPFFFVSACRQHGPSALRTPPLGLRVGSQHLQHCCVIVSFRRMMGHMLKNIASLLHILLWTGCCLLSLPCAAQQTWLEGRVVSQAEPEGVAGALVHLRGTSYGAYTDSVGRFRFAYRGELTDSLIVESIGYERSGVALAFYPNCDLHIALRSSSVDIESVRISANYAASKQKATTQTLRVVGAELISQRRQPTLSQTLEQVAGVHAMSIGNGASKPMIRGMGFNRIVVLDRGIKQEGQQWGADHGLELDQMAAEHVGVYKGATSLRFGGDAMGGAIVVNADMPRPLDGWHGKAVTWFASNAQLLGASAKTSYAGQRFFANLTLTATDYADYAVPQDTLVYLTQKLPIYDRRLKNTAGYERDGSLSLGWDSPYGLFLFTASHVAQKMGFFPGSHGIPSTDRVTPDGNPRNIEYPYATAHHTKLILNYRSHPQGRRWINYTDLGYQYNAREEYSSFHTHYPNQKQPEQNADLELAFRLQTLTAVERLAYKLAEGQQLEIGGEAQLQDHSFAGYSFLLPRYQRYTLGGFLTFSQQLGERVRLEAGVRGDWGHYRVYRYYDHILAHYLSSYQGLTHEDVEMYAHLSPDLHRDFWNVSGALGASWQLSPHSTLKGSLGRSFRLPSVHELAANGVHHGSFRHERGNVSLNSEVGYQADLEYLFSLYKWQIGLNPFASYYANYLYLEPTPRWSKLPDGGLIYQFTEARVFSYGGEIEVHGHLLQSLSFRGNMSWVYLDNLTDGYPLPFAPPLTVRGVLSWTLPFLPITWGHVTLEGEGHYAAAQERIARNELETPSSFRTDATLSYRRRTHLGEWTLRAGVHNLADRHYFNHLSYYRALGLPEPGRSWNVELSCAF